MSNDNSHDRREGGALARLRMVQAVRHQIEPMPSVDVIAPDSEVASIWRDTAEPWSDLIIQCLDLRIRLCLFPNFSSVQEAIDRSHLEEAQRILRHWPETTAVGLVAKPGHPEIVLVEPFDSHGSLIAPTGQRSLLHVTAGPGPIRSVLEGYLESLKPYWPPIPKVHTQPHRDLEGVVSEAVDAAARDLDQRATRLRTPTKRQALESLSDEDLETLKTLALRVVSGSEKRSIEAALTEMIDGES